jgi:two-component system response regulator DegU
MKAPIHIALAEDHVLFRQGLISLLKDYPEIKVVFQADNGREVMEQLKTVQPDILLLDIEMPIMNGDAVLSRLKQKHPRIKVIVLSQHTKESYVLEFMKKGARAFLSKYSDIEKIVEAIHSVNETGYYFESEVSEAMAKLISNKTSTVKEDINFPGVQLTERELEVLELICRSKSSREIAELLSLSKKTVDNHRFSIMKKTDTKNVLSLTTYALRNNIIKI